MLENMLFWLLVAAVCGFYRFTAARDRHDWARGAAGVLLISALCVLAYDLIAPLTRR